MIACHFEKRRLSLYLKVFKNIICTAKKGSRCDLSVLPPSTNGCTCGRYEETTLSRVRVVPGGKASLVVLGGIAAAIISNQAIGSLSQLLNR